MVPPKFVIYTLAKKLVAMTKQTEELTNHEVEELITDAKEFAASVEQLRQALLRNDMIAILAAARSVCGLPEESAQ
jgi:putative NADPH-quinone reductase